LSNKKPWDFHGDFPCWSPLKAKAKGFPRGRSDCAIEKFWLPLGELVSCLKAEDPTGMQPGSTGRADEN